MHLGIPSLLEFFRRHRTDEALALATIVETEGSTYRKPGAMMLAAANGEFEGLISGGCLESDLVHHLRQVLADGRPRRIEYDMHADGELVWSLGIGCDGVIRLLLQSLRREDDFGFLAPLARAQQARQPAVLSLVVEEGSPSAGRWHLRWGDRDGEAAGDPELHRVSASADPGGTWRTASTRLDGERGPAVLQVRMPPPVRVLICGAGPDAVPLASAFAALEWEVIVADHRPAYADPRRFPAGCAVHCLRPGQWSRDDDPAIRPPDAAVVMSHHLENDSAWLRSLKDLAVPYLGVLGPRARRQRLAEMAEIPAERLYGPVGLDIGAELPAAIALSVAAEVHAVLNSRDGRSLTAKV